jgi:site-specific DNA-methyltransferase (adenine-specific)
MAAEWGEFMETGSWKNKLYFGDNLDILREHVASETVDLIYLDPPFNSNATYNVLFQEKSGEQSAAQITAFEDTWHWGMESEYAYQGVVKEGPRKLADLLQAMRTFLGQNDMMAYLVMIAQRMVELHRVLRPTGSIYLHCDSTASHYLKLLMDAVFGPTNFRNEIIWKRTSAHSDAKRFGQVTDTILCYSKTSDRIWNPIQIQQDATYDSSFYRFEDERGRYRLHEIIRTASMGPRPNLVYEYKGYIPPWGWRMERPKLEVLDAEDRLVWSKTGRPYRKTYLPAGRSPTNLWTDIGNVAAQAKERLGYPTQKPSSLLERILQSSSNEGGLVLDPFCGCGTTIVVAERLKRQWIGIDITHLAISLMRHRLHDTFGPGLTPYEVIGDPKDLESARALAEQNRYQFEWWALGLVDARPAQDKRKGADRGVDGYINFFDDNSGKAKTVVVQVKSGHINRAHIATLKGDMEREKAPIGILITLEEPTRPMLQEAAAGGFYEPEYFPGHQYPRLQILTIQELLEGKEAKYPRMAPAATFKRAQRHRKSTEDQHKFPM